jgi:hypothetical protein
MPDIYLLKLFYMVTININESGAAKQSDSILQEVGTAPSPQSFSIAQENSFQAASAPAPEMAGTQSSLVDSSIPMPNLFNITSSDGFDAGFGNATAPSPSMQMNADAIQEMSAPMPSMQVGSGSDGMLSDSPVPSVEQQEELVEGKKKK